MLFVLLVMILLFYRGSVYESVGEVLKFNIAATYKINVVEKS